MRVRVQLSVYEGVRSRSPACVRGRERGFWRGRGRGRGRCVYHNHEALHITLAYQMYERVNGEGVNRK